MQISEAIELLVLTPPLLQGIGLGILAGIPGPISLLCIRRMLSRGKVYGFISGLGVSIADTFFGGTAILGVNFYSLFIQNNKFLFGIISGLILFILGTKIFLSEESKELKLQQNIHPLSFIGALSSTFSITMLHPGVVLFYATSFAFLRVYSNDEINLNTGQLQGIFLGSVSWWILWTILFSIQGNLLYKNLKKYILYINRLTGIVLVAAGGLLILSLL